MKKILGIVLIIFLSLFLFTVKIKTVRAGCELKDGIGGCVENGRSPRCNGTCDIRDGYKCVCVGGGGGGGANKDGVEADAKCNCTTEFGECGDNFGMTNIKWRQCKKNKNGTETCNWKKGIKYYQYEECDAGPTPTPGGPTETPTPTEEPTPTIDPDCKCNAINTCNNKCTFEKYEDVSYSQNIKCNLDKNLFQSTPTADNKNSWCQAALRTKGDADGDGVINFKDYFYYAAARLGFKIPLTVNPDFSGDNVIDDTDKTIIIKSLLGN